MNGILKSDRSTIELEPYWVFPLWAATGNPKLIFSGNSVRCEKMNENSEKELRRLHGTWENRIPLLRSPTPNTKSIHRHVCVLCCAGTLTLWMWNCGIYGSITVAAAKNCISNAIGFMNQFSRQILRVDDSRQTRMYAICRQMLRRQTRWELEYICCFFLSL